MDHKNLARSPQALKSLRDALKKHGITHDDIAAGCTPPVHRTTVVHALAGKGRTSNKNVIPTGWRLVREARARRKEGHPAPLPEAARNGGGRPPHAQRGAPRAAARTPRPAPVARG